MGQRGVYVSIDYGKKVYAHHGDDAEVAVTAVHLASAIKYALQVGGVVVVKRGPFAKKSR